MAGGCRFFKQPNLPDHPCSAVISGGLSAESSREILRYGVEVLSPEPEPSLPASIATHADMVFSYLGGGAAIISDKQYQLLDRFQKMNGTVVHRETIGAEYPGDAVLDLLLLDDRVFCNTRIISEKTKQYFKKNNIRMIHTNQAYVKCSVCVVSERAVITEDNGVFHAIETAGECDVLLIRPGAVLLSGYDRGFIGGCSGKLSESMLAFNGKIENHPDYRNIKSFCRQYGVFPLSLCNRQLYDNGGMIPVCY